MKRLLLPVLALLGALPLLRADDEAAPASDAAQVSAPAWPSFDPPAGVNPAAYPVPNLGGWGKKFKQNIDATKGKQFDLLFDGDSITDFWTTTGKSVWTEHYGQMRVADFGISGDMTEWLLWRLKVGQVEGMNPRLVVLLIGTNNLDGEHMTPAQVADGIKAIVEEYKVRCPQAHILVQGVFPRGSSSIDPMRAKIKAVNQIIAGLDDGDRVTFIDFGDKFLAEDGSLPDALFPDHLHPSAAGYKIWAEAIQPIVDKYVPRR